MKFVIGFLTIVLCSTNAYAQAHINGGLLGEDPIQNATWEDLESWNCFVRANSVYNWWLLKAEEERQQSKEGPASDSGDAIYQFYVNLGETMWTQQVRKCL